MRGRLMLSSCAWPRFMLVRWVRVGETIGGKGLPAGPSLPNHLLHAKGGASDNHEGNFRWANGCSEWHHFVRFAFVSLKPNTFTQVSKWGVCNWDVCAGRRVKLLGLNLPPSRTISYSWNLPSLPLSHLPTSNLHPHHSVSPWSTTLWYPIQYALLTNSSG